MCIPGEIGTTKDNTRRARRRSLNTITPCYKCFFNSTGVRTAGDILFHVDIKRDGRLYILSKNVYLAHIFLLIFLINSTINFSAFEQFISKWDSF